MPAWTATAKGLTASALVAAASLWATSASATLIGDEVGCTATFDIPTLVCSPSAAIVGAGSEFGLGESISSVAIDIDVGAETIAFTALDDIDFFVGDALSFSSLNWTDDPSGILSGVTLTAFAGVTGLEQGDISFGPDSITIDLALTDWSPGATATLSLETTDGSATVIPLPASAPLLLFTLAAAYVAKRRSSPGVSARAPA
ncbi:MAG: hypothetical protein AAGE80_19130 [Pseudomonadota bacterium]